MIMKLLESSQFPHNHWFIKADLKEAYLHTGQATHINIATSPHITHTIPLITHTSQLILATTMYQKQPILRHINHQT